MIKNKIIHTMEDISRTMCRVESLIKVLLKLVRDGDTKPKDIDAVIVAIYDYVIDMKEQTEEINKTLSI